MAARGWAAGRARLPELAALLVVSVWGINFVFLKAGLDQFDPLTFACLRFVGLLALGWAVLAVQRAGGQSIAIRRADLPRFAVAGGVGFTVYMLLWIVGLANTTAFSSALLGATTPLWAATFLALFRLEPITRHRLLGMLVAFLGIALFVSDKARAGQVGASAGDLLCLGASAAFAGYSVANRPLVGRYRPAVLVGYALLLGAIPGALLALPGPLGQDWGRVTPVGWLVMLWSITVPIYLSWLVWAWAIKHVGVARTANFLYLSPIVGGLASWLWLGEQFDALKLAGAAITLGGLALGQRAPPAPAEP